MMKQRKMMKKKKMNRKSCYGRILNLDHPGSDQADLRNLPLLLYSNMELSSRHKLRLRLRPRLAHKMTKTRMRMTTY